MWQNNFWTIAATLVPKLYLGTRFLWKLCFAVAITFEIKPRTSLSCGMGVKQWNEIDVFHKFYNTASHKGIKHGNFDGSCSK